jgi:hypothetical protein
MHRSRLRSRYAGLVPALAALAALALATVPGEAPAQELPWLTRGTARLDFAPYFWGWDSRYGTGPGGSPGVEALGSDLTADPLGSSMLPVLRDLETSLQDALSEPSCRVRLGRSQALVEQSRLVFPFRLELGVTDWLTVGAMVPLVRPRTELTFAFDADSLSADLGPSPWVTNPATVSQFLNGFETVLATARSAHPDHPEVAAAQAFFDALSRAYDHRSFFPLSGSGAGDQLQERLDHFRSTFSSLGVNGLPESVPMAQSFLDEAGFREYLAGGSMQAAPLENWTRIWTLGDVELSTSVRLLRGGFARDSLGEPSRIRYQLGAGMLVRLGTGGQADPNRFMDQDPGDGQTDLEGSIFGLVELGSRFGAWGQFRYGIQNEGEIVRRIASPEETLPHRARLASLYRTPGDYRELDINPRIHLTPAMSFGVRYRQWHKATDSHRGQPPYPDPPPAGVEPPPAAALLDLGTEQTLKELGFTGTFSSVDAHAGGKASLPLHIRASYFMPLDGSGGRTPKGSRFEAGLTLYQPFWGRPPKAPALAGPGTEPPGR